MMRGTKMCCLQLGGWVGSGPGLEPTWSWHPGVFTTLARACLAAAGGPAASAVTAAVACATVVADFCAAEVVVAGATVVRALVVLSADGLWC